MAADSGQTGASEAKADAAPASAARTTAPRPTDAPVAKGQSEPAARPAAKSVAKPAAKASTASSAADATPAYSPIVVNTPPGVLRLAGIACAITALWCLAGVVLAIVALVGGQNVSGVWFLLMFEATAAVACAFGAAAGFGRAKSGPALALFIAGGVVGVAAVLGEPAVATRLIGRPGVPTVVAGVELLPLALAQLAAGAGIVVLSSLAVLLRKPGKTLGRMVAGGLTLVPGLGLLGVFLLASASGSTGALGGRIAGLKNWLGSSPILAPVAVVAALAVIGVLLAAGIHLVIRAHEIGAEAGLDHTDARA
jgi:hypothetical protein